MKIEEITWNESDPTVTSRRDVPEIHIISTNNTYKNFVYTDEFSEACSQLELSVYIAIGVAALFVIVIAVVVISVIATLSYKKKYYQLLDNKSMTKDSARDAKEESIINKVSNQNIESPEALDKPA